tara:strand:- start:3981 stop:5435 length:1455 start_codon:yes stop_codon:yes gene_type:complete
MARTTPSDILGILDRIYTHKERREQRELDTSLKMMQFQMAEDAREDAQAHEMAMVEKRNQLQLQNQYPGITFDANGQPDFANYDVSESLASRTNNFTAISEELRNEGISISGLNEQEIQTKHKHYIQGKNRGLNLAQSYITPSATQMAGGDMSPGYLTQQDVVDFEDQYYGAGGHNNSMALQSLIDARIIDSDILGIDESTGMWTADDNARDLIDVTIKGLKTGVMNNRHYMDNVKYEEHLNTKRQNDAMFAEQMTGHPTVVRASNIYSSTAKSIGTNSIGYQLSDSGVAMMMWGGELTAIEDIKRNISKRKDMTSGDKKELLTYFNMLSQVDGEGNGLATVFDTANSRTDAQGRSRLLQLVKKVNPSLAASLATGLNQWNKIEKVSNIAGRFIHAPEDPTVANDFRVLINNSGLSNSLQQLRQLELEGKDTSQLTSEVSKLIREIRMQVKDNPSLKNQFRNYLELEEATANIYQESIKNRRNK